MIRWLLLLLLAAAPAPLAASLYDRDSTFDNPTPPSGEEVIAGAFPLYPPQYYEMRLARCAEAIKTTPTSLAEYDDAACACFHLGRLDDAIAWMRQKQAVMAPEETTYAYRAHCNLATFLSHRWAKAGCNRADMRDLSDARKELSTAIKKYPAAVQRRDRLQLVLLDATHRGNAAAGAEAIPDMFGLAPRSAFAMSKAELAAAGVSDDQACAALYELIHLGGERNNIDVHLGLGIGLAIFGRRDLCDMCIVRAIQLAATQPSWLAPTLDAAARQKALRSFAPGFAGTEKRAEAEISKLQTAFAKKQASRDQYLLSRLKAGRHPDTEANFWREFNAAPNIKRPTESDGIAMSMAVLIPAAGIGLVVLVCFCLLIFLMIRRHKAIPTVKDI